MNNPIKTKKKMQRRKIFWRFLEYAAPSKGVMVFIMIGTVLLSALQLVSTYMMKPLTDTVFVPKSPLTSAVRMQRLNFLIFMLIVLFLFQVLLGAWLDFLKKQLGEKIGVRVRDDIFRKLHKLPMTFYNQQQTGELQAFATYHVNAIQNFVVYDVTSLLMFIGIGTVLTFLNFRLMVLLLLPIPVAILLTYFSGKRINTVMRKVYQKYQQMSSNIYTNIVAAAVIKTNTAENFEYRKFEKSNIDVCRSWLEVARLSLIYGPLAALVFFLSGEGVKWFGGRQIISGEMSLGDLMVFIGYGVQFHGPVHSLTWIYERFQSTAAAGLRIFSVLDQKEEVPTETRQMASPVLRGGVRFDKVAFGYTPEKDVLKDITFEVRPGETIGITGPSGAGKTTMISLLCRLYEPGSGAIYVDSNNVRDVDKQCLRGQIGLILQDTLLFQGTIAENIAYAHPTASPSDIIAAAKSAGAHYFISRMPEAYDSIIGERGSGLSGGEKQRISIARALLRKPRIIVFDEATSSLDSATELFIQEKIKGLAGQHTVFIITHRVSMLCHVDKLIILDKGVIRAMGSYGDIVRSNIFLELMKMKEYA